MILKSSVAEKFCWLCIDFYDIIIVQGYILSWIEKLAYDMVEISPEIFKTENDVSKEMKAVMKIVGQYTKLEQFKFLVEDLEKII